MGRCEQKWTSRRRKPFGAWVLAIFSLFIFFSFLGCGSAARSGEESAAPSVLEVLMGQWTFPCVSAASNPAKLTPLPITLSTGAPPGLAAVQSLKRFFVVNDGTYHLRTLFFSDSECSSLYLETIRSGFIEAAPATFELPAVLRNPEKKFPSKAIIPSSQITTADLNLAPQSIWLKMVDHSLVEIVNSSSICGGAFVTGVAKPAAASLCNGQLFFEAGKFDIAAIVNSKGSKLYLGNKISQNGATTEARPKDLDLDEVGEVL